MFVCNIFLAKCDSYDLYIFDWDSLGPQHIPGVRTGNDLDSVHAKLPARD